MSKIRLEISALTAGHSQGSFSLILNEVGGKRKLPIMIGGFEAQAIAIEIEHIKTSRPLTHDLFKTTMNKFGVNLEEVFIYELKEGIFFANLVVEHNGVRHEIDSRTSDAIALAVRFACPVYTTPEIMNEAGFEMEDEENAAPARPAGDDIPQTARHSMSNLRELNIEELEKLLEEAIREEDYIRAAEIRDELKKRKE